MTEERLTRHQLDDPLPSYIVIEGPIGAGKTTLSKLLAETFEGGLILEDAAANPFLSKFYAGEKNAALATQLFFLMQRSQQVERLGQQDLFSRTHIADYLIDKDRLFAELTLTSDELALYDQVARHLAIDAPTPNLVIYLQASVDVLLRRIQLRGIDHEKAIHADYLHSVNEAYSRFFHFYQGAPLLIVNASDLDWVNRVEDFNGLVKYLLKIRSGRHFYNPPSKL